jgi:hypothetical protein
MKCSFFSGGGKENKRNSSLILLSQHGRQNRFRYYPVGLWTSRSSFRLSIISSEKYYHIKKGIPGQVKANKSRDSHFNEVEVEAEVEEKKSFLESTVLTGRYRKFQGFSLT